MGGERGMVYSIYSIYVCMYVCMCFTLVEVGICILDRSEAAWYPCLSPSPKERREGEGGKGGRRDKPFSQYEREEGKAKGEREEEKTEEPAWDGGGGTEKQKEDQRGDHTG